jgi:uronate dehydrogenase
MSELWNPKKVLITGAAGTIGSVLREGLKGKYETLALSDIVPLGAAAPGEEIFENADIRDLDATAATMEGVDCVVHLAGIPVEAEWEKILPMNLIGCYNVFEAARRAGVKRMVFASSNHAVGYYRRAGVIDTDVQPRPDSRYGVSKVYGEALGRLYADKHGMAVSCLRIGSFQPKPQDLRQLMTWISHRDTVHLVERCVDHPDYHFVAVYGVSDNTRNKWDNSKVDWLGYRPQDNAEDYAAELYAKEDTEHPIAKPFHGGMFCPMEFSGDLNKID